MTHLSDALTFGSLCSGIGGLDLALEDVGMSCAWQCDNDPAALSVLAHHWPDVKRFANVKEIDGSATRVDVVCGGFPCQPHSVAGRRRGIEDARWLWPEFARIIGELRPSTVFIENVPGLRTSGLRHVLADLAGLGFDAEWDLFFAAEAGAPHRRQRLFILAYADREQLRRQSLERSPGKNGPHENGEARDAPDSGSGKLRIQQGGGRWASGTDPVVAGFSRPPWVAADANRVRGLQPSGGIGEQWRWTRDGDGWAFESPVSGVAHGIPRRMDRHRLTGNAVVWQQAALAWKVLRARAAA